MLGALRAALVATLTDPEGPADLGQHGRGWEVAKSAAREWVERQPRYEGIVPEPEEELEDELLAATAAVEELLTSVRVATFYGLRPLCPPA